MLKQIIKKAALYIILSSLFVLLPVIIFLTALFLRAKQPAVPQTQVHFLLPRFLIQNRDRMEAERPFLNLTPVPASLFHIPLFQKF